jgi:hypothetical protein
VRTSVAACVLGAILALGGGFLLGVWCLGLVLIVEGGLVVAWGVFRDDGTGPAARVPEVSAVEQVFDRARAS